MPREPLPKPRRGGDRGGAARALPTTGNYPLEGYAPELDMPKGAQLADGPVGFRKATREQLEHGADWIKVYMRARAAVHGPSFQRALKAGVKIVFGTDVGSFEWTDPNSPIAMEFSRMVEFGMAPMAAIKSATTVPAEMLDMAGQVGVIAPGAYADVIAVVGDPLRSVKVLESVVFVMKDGEVFRNELK